MRTLLCALVAFAPLACKREQPALLSAFTLKFVDDARGSGIPDDAIDEELIVRLHRAQKLKIASKGGAPAEIMVKIWHDESETHGSPEERSQKQRLHAQTALQRSLRGDCRVEIDQVAAKLRVEMLTEPGELAPDEVKNGLGRLRQDLAGAAAARITCQEGKLGLLVVPRGRSFRVVDLFQIGAGPKMDIKPQ